LHARVKFDGHAHGTTKRLEYGFYLMVRIVAAHIVDMQAYLGMIDEALKKLEEQVHVKVTHCAALERNVVFKPRAP